MGAGRDSTRADSGLIRVLEYHLEHVDLPYCGRGLDPWHEDAELDHPMAYALYLRGLAHLHRATGNDAHLQAASVVLDRLLEIASPGTEVAWGLPFEWRNLPANHPYTITTAICALAIADLHRVAPQTRTLDLLDGVCEWLIDGVEWQVRRRGAGPGFAPGWTYLATNVVSMTAAALDAGFQATGRAQFRDSAAEAVAYVIDQQGEQGWWTYADSDSPRAEEEQGTQTIDNVHTAYTLDGLVGCLGLTTTRDTRDWTARVKAGAQFYFERLYEPSGRGREKLTLLLSGSNEADAAESNPRLDTSELDKRRVVAAYPQETRLWGYGAALGMLARGSARGLVRPEAGRRVLRWVLLNHAAHSNGRFSFLSDDPRAFPRHEAHLFEGLAAWSALVE